VHFVSKASLHVWNQYPIPDLFIPVVNHSEKKKMLTLFSDFSIFWAPKTHFRKKEDMKIKKNAISTLIFLQHSRHILVFNIPVLSRLGVEGYENSSTV
jgi:hypothetical protein